MQVRRTAVFIFVLAVIAAGWSARLLLPEATGPPVTGSPVTGPPVPSPHVTVEARYRRVVQLAEVERLTPDDWELVHTALGDRSSDLRIAAEYTIGSLGVRAAGLEVPLTAALGDPCEEVRVGAARALSRIGARGAQARTGLRGALKDESVAVRIAAAHAIRALVDDTEDPDRRAAEAVLRPWDVGKARTVGAMRSAPSRTPSPGRGTSGVPRSPPGTGGGN